MADSKKYDGSQWEHSLRKLTTATESVENPLYSDGTAITAYTLKGNTVQSGNPVEVNGVGVRTENLSTIFSPNTASSGGMNFEGVGDKLRLYGDTDTYVQCISTNNINLTAGTYTIFASSTRNNSACYVQFRSEDGTSTYATIPLNSSTTVTFNTAVSGRIRVICQASTYYNTDELISIMINAGSTAKPYEPYGYKIPISSGQQTIDIYIGDLPLLKSLDGTAVDEISNGILTRRVDSDGSVLPTPTTTQITMPSIPTTDGANSITVDTTVQPSEFTATWTGWHDASVKEKSENLFDGTLLVGFYEPDINTLFTDNPNYRSFRIQGLPAGQYTVSWNIPVNLVRVYYDGMLYSNAGESLTSYTVTSSDGDIAFSFRDATAPTTPWSNSNTVMLNSGSTALPYEPYWQ